MEGINWGGGGPRWLSAGLREALAHPADDPLGAILAAQRLLRAGELDADSRRILGERISSWIGAAPDLIGTALECWAGELLEQIHSWVSTAMETHETLQRAFPDARPWPEPVEVAWASPPFSAWRLVARRDDAESLVSALARQVLRSGADEPAFWERFARERLEGPDRVGTALARHLGNRLARETPPPEATWVREVAARESGRWWLDAVVRSAAIGVDISKE